MRALGRPDRACAGAIGEPGRRRFFFTVQVGTTELWYLIEKQQAAALAERGVELLKSVGHELGTGVPASLGDREPGHVEFRVGTMAIGLVADEPLVVVTLAPLEEDEDEEVVFELSYDQLDGMIQAALTAVMSGRPMCRRCNLPKDPEGHACPASNGDLRRHRT